jgi:hypothetical protein
MSDFLNHIHPDIKWIITITTVVGSIWGVGVKFGADQQALSDQVHNVELAIDGKDGLRDHLTAMEEEINKHSAALAVILGKKSLPP